MYLYRIASRRYAADNSEGARLYGGPWNRPGTPVIYASGTKSLAALEVIVHNGAIPTDYQVVVIELPDALAIKEISSDDLPPDWPGEDAYSITADRGNEWAASLKTAVLRVPSAVIPAEHNYVLNPAHPDFTRIQFAVPEGEQIDQRLLAHA